MFPDGVDTHWEYPHGPLLLSTVLKKFCGVTAEGWEVNRPALGRGLG